MSAQTTRRRLFALLGASSASAMLPWLRTPAAQGSADDVPKRIIFVETTLAARRGSWAPTVEEGRPDPLEIEYLTDWELRGSMRRFEAYRDQVNLFQNLDMLSALADPTPHRNGHLAHAAHFMSANFMDADNLALHPTIDQFIAQKLVEAGQVTRLRSLELLVRSDSRNGFIDRYAQPAEKLPAFGDLNQAWEHVFSHPVDADSEAHRRLVAKKTSAFDYIRSDYETLLDAVGAEDRAKLQAMLDHRADLHRALTLSSPRATNRPERSELFGPLGGIDDSQEDSPGNPKWRVKAPIFAGLMAAAVHTDTTRVGNLVIPPPPDHEFDFVKGRSYGNVAISDWHHLWHESDGDNHAVELPPEAIWSRYDQAVELGYDQIVGLLDMLAGLPETDGQTLLDHCLIVVTTHLGAGSHDYSRLPFLTIGSANGALKTGRYVRCPIHHKEDDSNPGDLTYPEGGGARRYNFRGRAHNDLFTTVARAMGVEVEHFGADVPGSRGAFSGLLV